MIGLEGQEAQRLNEATERMLDREDAERWAAEEIERIKAFERGDPVLVDRQPRRRPRDPQLAAQVLQQMLEALKEGD